MSLSKVLSLFALCSFSVVSVAACSANTDATDENPADTSASADEELRASIFSCQTDDDCVAVAKGGCCSNGWKEAVNKHHIKAYENGTKCTQVPHPMCPMYMVRDTRVAECNSGTHKCEMVAIDAISCGGFVAHPHTCPDGYSCDVTGNIPDMPGKCVQDPPPPPPPSDCRDTGCSDANQECSLCWGKFACIPKGAMC